MSSSIVKLNPLYASGIYFFANVISILKVEAESFDLEYTRIGSFVFAAPIPDICLPVRLFNQVKLFIKFSSPKNSSQINFRFACSLSSILIKITPSSLSNSRARTRRGYIKVSQAE